MKAQVSQWRLRSLQGMKTATRIGLTTEVDIEVRHLDAFVTNVSLNSAGISGNSLALKATQQIFKKTPNPSLLKTPKTRVIETYFKRFYLMLLKTMLVDI